MIFFKRMTLALVAMAAVIAAPANAAAPLLRYVLTGDYKATFYIFSSAPRDFADAGSGIGYANVQGTFPGSSTGYLADIGFYNSSFGGGLSIIDFFGGGAELVVADGPQLYSGAETGTPTLLTGAFSLIQTGGSKRYLLNVAVCDCDVPAVPEPATWAMMLVGFGLLGGALRSRPVRVVFARQAV